MKKLAIAVLSVVTLATVLAQEPVNLDVVHRIRDEALQNSRVMDHLFYLTDVNGPRLTNSPGYFKAANWIVGQMQSWGIDARLESWGPFGRGWEFTHFSAQMIEPAYAPLIGVPLAWTPGTSGAVTGEAVIAVIANDADIERYRGQLKDKIVFLGTGRDLTMRTTAPGTRYSDQQLSDLAAAPTAGRGAGAAPGVRALTTGPGRSGAAAPAGPGAPFANRLNQFFAEEHVLAVARIGAGQSDGGTVFAQSGGSRDAKDPLAPPTFALTPEHYNRVLRLLDRGIPVKLEVDIRARFIDDRTDSANVVAEIPGRTKPGEVVMIGAHLDSWHGGTGATDNAAGSAVMMEVMRILKTLNLPMDRTVRMGLWGGEEQGLFGSQAYVTQHFADRRDMKLKPEHAKFSAYFNVDNGTGRIRGVYPPGKRSDASDFRRVVQAACGSWRRDHQHPEHRRDRPYQLRCRGIARLPVHPGSNRVRHPDTPLEHGCLRPCPGGRSPAGGRDRRLVRLQRRDPAGSAAAQAASRRSAAGRRSRRWTGEQLRSPKGAAIPSA